MSTIFGQAARVGIVVIEQHNERADWKVQLRAEDAQALANNLLAAAEAARGEQALWRVCERIGTPELMQALLLELRSIRLIEQEQSTR